MSEHWDPLIALRKERGLTPESQGSATFIGQEGKKIRQTEMKKPEGKWENTVHSVYL